MFKISAHFKIGLFWSFFGIGLWVPDIFWILTVPDTWFANILSHSVACLCVFLIVSFAVQKFFSLMHSYFLIYAFAACALGVKSRKSLPKPMPRGLPSTISFRSFMLIDFVLVLNPFQDNYVSHVSWGLSFILLQVNIQFSQHHSLKKISFLLSVSLAPLSNISWSYVYGFISGLLILPHWSMYLFMPI